MIEIVVCLHCHGAKLHTALGCPDDPACQEAAIARKIYTGWMTDERWRKAHLHPPEAPQDYPIAYFWAELAARAVLRS